MPGQVCPCGRHMEDGNQSCGHPDCPLTPLPAKTLFPRQLHRFDNCPYCDVPVGNSDIRCRNGHLLVNDPQDSDATRPTPHQGDGGEV